MNILVVIGDSIKNNSSTNIFKRLIITELKKNHIITVVMDNDSKHFNKTNTYDFDKVKYVEFSRLFLLDILVAKIKDKKKSSGEKKNSSKRQSKKKEFKYLRSKKIFISFKKSCLKLYKNIYEFYIEIFYKRYRYNSMWLKRAKKYRSKTKYDLLISISHPPASHKLAFDLLDSNNVETKKWIQIWFEDWYNKPKTPKKSSILIKKEHNLLSKADKIFYSNKLLLDSSKTLFVNLAEKMDYFDLPCKSHLTKRERDSKSEFSVGYFGAYFSNVRNINPLYQVMKEFSFESYIIGPSDVSLNSTANIQVLSQKISVSECKKKENTVDLLIVLSNMHSNSLPGKIYTYGMTNQPVLIILDGTDKVRKFIKSYFGKFERYYFCNNNVEDIKNQFVLIEKEYRNRQYNLVNDFLPENILKKIIK